MKENHISGNINVFQPELVTAIRHQMNNWKKGYFPFLHPHPISAHMLHVLLLWHFRNTIRTRRKETATAVTQYFIT